MMRPMCVFRPIAGNQSLIELIRRKIATTASSCGNICTTTIEMSPNRRPVNRMREKEYAARAPRNTVPTAVTPATSSVLPNHAVNGTCGSVRMRR
jgi:hypothetical protein